MVLVFHWVPFTWCVVCTSVTDSLTLMEKSASHFGHVVDWSSSLPSHCCCCSRYSSSSVDGGSRWRRAWSYLAGIVVPHDIDLYIVECRIWCHSAWPIVVIVASWWSLKEFEWTTWYPHGRVNSSRDVGMSRSRDPSSWPLAITTPVAGGHVPTCPIVHQWRTRMVEVVGPMQLNFDGGCCCGGGGWIAWSVLRQSVRWVPWRVSTENDDDDSVEWTAAPPLCDNPTPPIQIRADRRHRVITEFGRDCPCYFQSMNGWW